MATECDIADADLPQGASQYEVDANEAPSIAVIRAVAEASGRSPTGAGTDALDPLTESIDPEALDSIFESRGDDPEDAAFIAFEYCDHQVTVRGGRTVCVTVQ